MTETQVVITITAGTPQQLMNVQGTMCCKVSAQVASGATGPLVYVGGPTLNKSTKAGVSEEIGTSGTALGGGYFQKGSEDGANVIDASTVWFDGDHTGDVVLATYSQR